MKRKLTLVIPPVLVTVAALAALGMSTISHSREAHSAVVVAEKLSPVEEATIRSPRRGMPTEPAADAAITAHAKTIVGGELWKIVSYRSKSGQLCAGVTWPGEGQAMSCATRRGWFARGPVSVEIGARQAPDQPLTWQDFVLSGVADISRVQRIELISTDCSKKDIPMDSGGFFLDVTNADSIAAEVWPYTVVAYTVNGQVAQRIPVEPKAPDTEAARAAGVRAPAPAPQCA